MRNNSRQIVPAWISAEGPGNDVALSTRTRLARNIQGSPFPSHCRDVDLKRVADRVLDAVYDSDNSQLRFGKLRVIHPGSISASADRLALADSYIASRQHVSGGKYRPIVLNENCSLSLMVNEEDHLRIQCILPGLQPMTSLQMAQEFDFFLASKISFIKTDNYGYLTSSLANIGTGLRLSVMLHLAGLALLEEAVPTLEAAAELKISVRGMFGEGTEALGDIYQVSNVTTIGFSEKEITSRVRAAVEHLISREREARHKLAINRTKELREAAEQSWDAIMDAHSLSGKEALACLSLLRLGASLESAPSITAKTFNELLVSMKLGDLASASGNRVAESISGGVKRARLVKDKLMKESGGLQLSLLD